MAGITLAQAESKLSNWMTMEDKLMKGEEVSLGSGDKVRYPTLEEVRGQIEFWERKVKELEADSGGAVTPKSIVPIDL